jgi:Co/Zn/Cd efflux system component
MDECCRVNVVSEQQRHVFRVVLIINVSMFLVEAIAGILANSTALLADSVDMLGDAIVYGFSLYVIGRGAVWQPRAAFLKGIIMATFGLGILAQVVFKILHGIVPTAEVMGLVGFMALIANVVCLMLLWQRHGDDINMRSAWICSRNDVIGNVGVLLGALAVGLTSSPWPDIVIGLLIAAVFFRSAIFVIRDASREFQFSN